MSEAWGRLIYRRRKIVLVIALLFAAIGGSWGTTIFGSVQTAGGFTAPDSASQQEDNLATAAFGRDAGDVVVLYSSPTLTVASPAFRSAVTSTLAALPRDRALSAATYWSTGSREFASTSGHDTYAVIELAGTSDSARQASYDAIKAELSAPGLRSQTGGIVAADETIDQQTTASITRAESLSLPILLILLLVIFGGLAAASLPLAIGVLGILGSFTALRLLTLITGVSVFSLNITTILGLGLGIDYGLFLVSRFREELHRQDSVPDAVARTVATAGRTVLVSGATVAIVLASLMLFPETILRSIGYGGVATVLVDMIAALTVLPALLAVLGPRVNSLRIRRSVQRPPGAEGTGGWSRLAHSVLRRPVRYAVAIIVLLLALGSPFLRVVWGGVDATALPASSAPRLVTETLNRDFPGNPTAPIESVVQFGAPIAGSPARAAALAAYTSRLRHVPGVASARITGTRGDIGRVDLGYAPGPYTPAARAILAGVRDVRAPAGATAYVGGQTAQLADELSSLGQRLPAMALTVVIATFLLMFTAFGSLILPLQAIAANVLSLSAMYGVMTWIFQDGHLSGLLDFTPNGTISPTIPVLMFAIMFGLSMDYEVFLLARIKERYDATGDHSAAIAAGLQRTGAVITSAALLLVIVVGAFSASSITFIKMMGVGMIVALVLDATLVRLLLVPATMRLLGSASWWAPAPLRRLYARYGIHEQDTMPAQAPEGPEIAIPVSRPLGARVMPASHVVLGAGPVGRAVVTALLARGIQAAVLTRSGTTVTGTVSLRADLTSLAAATAAVAGAQVVFQCTAPPYHRWPEQFPELQAHVVAAATSAGALLVVAENLYGYGPVAGPLTEALPPVATTRKGAVRARLWQDLAAGHQAGRLPVVAGRASDLFGPGVGRGSVVGSRFFSALSSGRPAEVTGDPDRLHSYTYVADFGEALVRLSQAPHTWGRAWHVPNAPAISTRAFADRIAALAGQQARLRKVAGWQLRLAGLAIPAVREMTEMRYEFENDWVVDHRDYTAALGDHATPRDTALTATLPA